MNGARGEASVEVAGRMYPLCLTLGALSEIETALGCASLSELQVRMKSPSAAELGRVLEALLRGGGATGGEVEAICRQCPAGVAAKAVAKAFHAALG
ncbi:GTA-gp10 family protein [Henriciella sp. AS95]|uniref:GTA-gp10 family protein n=1 Tax=Henriciella sp. AS95 TaxID=3135782 RepID=UPI00316D137A